MDADVMPGPAGDAFSLNCLCALTAIVPLTFVAVLFDPYLVPKEALLESGTALLMLLWVTQAWGGALTVPLTAACIPLGCLALAGALPALWSTGTFAGGDDARRLGFCCLLYLFALSRLHSPGTRARLAAALVTAGAIEAVYILVQYTMGDPFLATEGLHGKWQTFGTLGNPNWTGEFLAVAGLVALGGWAGGSLPGRRWLLAAYILILVALAATFARGAWLGCACGTAAWLWMRRPAHRLRLTRAGLAALGCGVAVVLAFWLGGNRWAAHDLLNLQSVRGRIWMWIVSWAMIRDAPWLGHGPGSFGMVFPVYQARVFSQAWASHFLGNASFTPYAHSDYLQAWAETGLPGVGALAGLTWIVLRRGRQLAADGVALGCWAALLALLINASIAFPLHLPSTLMLFVVLLGLVEAAGCRRVARIPLASRWSAVAAGLLALALCGNAGHWSWRQVSADLALRRSSMALRDGRWSDAEACAATAIRNAPGRPEGYLASGRLAMEQGRYAQALAAFNAALKLAFDPRAFEWKALALTKTGQTAEAFATINELTRLRPDLRGERRQ